MCHIDEPLWTGVVYESAELVLDTMFFCSVYGKSPARPSPEAISARLRFEGHPSGTMIVGISPAAAHLITSNFLGLESNAPTQSQVEQVTSELANIICGNILAKAGSDKTYCLGSPEIVQLPSLPQGAISTDLEIEGGLFTTYLTFD